MKCDNTLKYCQLGKRTQLSLSRVFIWYQSRGHGSPVLLTLASQPLVPKEFPKQTQAFTINHIVSINSGVAQSPTYTKTLSGRIFQDLRGYLLGAGQGPIFYLECAGFEHSSPAELTLSHTPLSLTSTTVSHAPHTRAISFSLYSDSSVPLHVLFLLPGIPFHLSCPSLPTELSLILKSLGKHPSCERPSWMPPGRLSPLL